MGTVIFGAAVVVLLFVMPVLSGRFDERQTRRVPLRRAIEARETTAIAGLREGELAKVRGVVAAREPLLTSPRSGRPCIGYRIVIDDVSRDPALVWNPVVSQEAWCSFLVQDDTGTVVVEGPLDIAADPSDFASDFNLPPSVQGSLAKDDARTRDLFWRTRRFWYRETLLKVGDRVSVLGRPSLEIDPAGHASFRDAPRLYVMRGSADEPVAVIDDDEPPG